MICSGLKRGLSEAPALEKGNAKLLYRYASQNDLVDKALLDALERIHPSPVSAKMWQQLLSNAHVIEDEQAQLVEKAQAGDLGTVRKLMRAKRARRRELATIAKAAHLSSCGAFI